jgi:hypothetical protein
VQEDMNFRDVGLECYGMNVCVPSNFICRNPAYECDSAWKGN